MALQNLIKLVTGGGLKKRAWQELCHDVLRLQDDATGLRLAEEILTRYQAFERDEALAFFQFLLNEFRVDHDALGAAIDAYQQDPSPINVQAVNRASLPSRRKIFELLNMCPEGMQCLLHMRGALKGLRRDDPGLAAVDSDLEILFRNWFNRGLLRLERIDWNTPAFVLEKLIQYEAVHEITGWDDLKRRVSRGRRCYAFFHPVVPHEPVIFVQVALTNGLVASIDQVIGEDAIAHTETPADTAIFYSISNCQDGLRGIAFGDLLIKQVVDLISAEFPQIRTFATLSPIPGFAAWVTKCAAESEEETLISVCQQIAQPDWWLQANDALKQDLMALCATYLTGVGPDRRPLDPVARFHLRNGARLERINWLGDTSPKGLSQSHGMLVNYVYDLATVTKNHEKFVYEHIVTSSNAVRQLAAKRA